MRGKALPEKGVSKMIQIVKYCRCGERFEANAIDHDRAYAKVMDWYERHVGLDHGPVTEREWKQIVARTQACRAVAA
jgi:hypothetical protein